MIVKGKFEALSMAIYGDLVSDLSSPEESYEPKPLPSVESRPLSKAVDPANSLDPTTLARNLLSLISNAPPLSLVIRLMFCMKPANEDWDMPDFPYLFTDLLIEAEDFDLDKAIQIISKPIPEAVSEDALTKFAEAIGRCIGAKVCLLPPTRLLAFNRIIRLKNKQWRWRIFSQSLRPNIPPLHWLSV